MQLAMSCSPPYGVLAREGQGQWNRHRDLPGGGYQHLAIDKEGHDIARWLNTIGIAAVV